MSERVGERTCRGVRCQHADAAGAVRKVEEEFHLAVNLFAGSGRSPGIICPGCGSVTTSGIDSAVVRPVDEVGG